MLKINLHYKNSTKVDISKNIIRKVKLSNFVPKIAKVGDSRRFLLSMDQGCAIYHNSVFRRKCVES